MKYKSEIISMDTSLEIKDLQYSEKVTHMFIKDEGAGQYIELEQAGEFNGCIRLGMEELEFITAEAKKLIGHL
jgi:hypothetical protein